MLVVPGNVERNLNENNNEIHHQLFELNSVMFENIFKRKKIILNRLIAYGFKKENFSYQYITDILNDEFTLIVDISKNGEKVDTKLIEKETGEPYVLYKTNAEGTFVGNIRSAIEEVLTDIASKCYEEAIFKNKQTQVVIDYVRKTYGNELEFLWKKFPDNAVFRRTDNKKWYGAILTVIGNKIGLDTNEIVEIIDLRMNPKEAKNILSKNNYYKGWHMNKKSWFTIVLDGSVPNKELKSRIDDSYKLAI